MSLDGISGRPDREFKEWSDEELVLAAVGSGEAPREAALTEIRARYELLVKRDVRYHLDHFGCRCGEGDRAEAVQDAWAMITENVGGVKTSLRGWLRGMCTDAASRHADRCRGARRRLVQPDEAPDAPAGEIIPFWQVYEDRSLWLWLLEEARTLDPPTFGEVFRLRYEEGLTTREIAERLGRGHDAVRKELQRGLRRLVLRVQPKLNGGNR